MKSYFSNVILFLQLIVIQLLISCKADPVVTEKPQFRSDEIRDTTVVYAEAYFTNPARIWQSELDLPSVSIIIPEYIFDKFNNIRNDKKKLKADIYFPPGLDLRPLIIFIHGGAFVEGERTDPAIVLLCKEMAQRGFVTASIDYRLMNALTPSFIKAGYCAIQDAREAVRYFVDHAEEFNIDTSIIYLGGISAGACTAIHAAFLTDDEHILGREYKLDEMYGCLDCVDGADEMVPVKGVINIAGAAYSLDLLKGNDNTRIWSFHGDKDDVLVPNVGLPFPKYTTQYNSCLDSVVGMLSKFCNTDKLKEAAFFNVYGSQAMHKYMQKHNIPSTLYMQKGKKHNLILGKSKTPTDNGRNIIRTIARELQKDVNSVVKPNNVFKNIKHFFQKYIN